MYTIVNAPATFSRFYLKYITCTHNIKSRYHLHNKLNSHKKQNLYNESLAFNGNVHLADAAYLVAITATLCHMENRI